jgi:hypothetical protein
MKRKRNTKKSDKRLIPDENNLSDQNKKNNVENEKPVVFSFVSKERRNFLKNTAKGVTGIAGFMLLDSILSDCEDTSKMEVRSNAGNCTCHVVCTCDKVKKSKESSQKDQVWENDVCTCNLVCTCNTVCTCNSEGGGGGSTSYWYPN